jgi:hypothetical protein
MCPVELLLFFHNLPWDHAMHVSPQRRESSRAASRQQQHHNHNEHRNEHHNYHSNENHNDQQGQEQHLAADVAPSVGSTDTVSANESPDTVPLFQFIMQRHSKAVNDVQQMAAVFYYVHLPIISLPCTPLPSM